MNLIGVDYLIVIVEILVLLFLIWHIKELSETTREVQGLVKEIHSNHALLHKDTKASLKAVQRLEKDLAKVHDLCQTSSKKKKT